MNQSSSYHTDQSPEKLERRRKRRSGGPRWWRKVKRRAKQVRWGMIILGIAAFVAVVAVSGVALAADSNNQVQASLESLNRVLISLENRPRTDLTLTDFNRLKTSVDDVTASLQTARTRLGLLQPVRSFNSRLDASMVQIEAAQNLAQAGQAMLNGLQPTLFFLVAGDDNEQVISQISSGQRVVELMEIGRSEFLKAKEFLVAGRDMIDNMQFDGLMPDLLLNADSLSRFHEQLQQTNEILLDTPNLLTSALGLDREQNYLILSQNSDELRPSGGYISTFGWMTVRNGRIINYNYGPTTATNPNPPPATMADEVTVPDWWIGYNQPLYAAWDGSWYADFPSTAEMAMWYYNNGNNPQSPVSGVIAIDLAGFEKLMGALDNVVVPGYEQVITQDNFREVVYDIRATGASEQQHKRFVANVYQQIFDDWQVASADPDTSAQLLGELLTGLQEKHMMLYFADEQMNRALTLLGWAGNQLPGRDHDYLLVADANLGNKSNRSIVRQLTYDVDIQPDGRLNNRLAIAYDYSDLVASSDPAVDPEYHGPLDYRNLLQVFAPLNSQLTTTDNLVREPEVTQTDNHSLFVTRVNVEYDTSERYQFVYNTPALVEQIGPYQRYRLLIQKQPGTQNEAVNVQVTLPEGATAIGITPEAAASYDLERPIIEFRLMLDSDQWVEVIYQQGGN